MNESLAVRSRSRGENRHGRNNETSFLRALELDVIERIEFFQAFIREPATVGAFSPSSRSLAKAMVEGLSLRNADTVVEIGPGTGAFTSLIRQRIGRKTTFIALELNEINSRGLKRRFPDLFVYNDSAERIRDYLSLHGKQSADYVISGLPWASMPLPVQERIMQAILSALSPVGAFTTFAYLHARLLPTARQFKHRLNGQFRSVVTSPVIWWNLPPALVYRCSNAVSVLS